MFSCSPWQNHRWCAGACKALTAHLAMLFTTEINIGKSRKNNVRMSYIYWSLFTMEEYNPCLSLHLGKGRRSSKAGRFWLFRFETTGTQVSSHLQVPVLQCLGHLDVLFFSLPSVTGTFRAINYGLIPTQMGGLHSADHDLDIVPSDAESP